MSTQEARLHLAALLFWGLCLFSFTRPLIAAAPDASSHNVTSSCAESGDFCGLPPFHVSEFFGCPAAHVELQDPGCQSSTQHFGFDRFPELSASLCLLSSGRGMIRFEHRRNVSGDDDAAAVAAQLRVSHSWETPIFRVRIAGAAELVAANILYCTPSISFAVFHLCGSGDYEAEIILLHEDFAYGRANCLPNDSVVGTIRFNTSAVHHKTQAKVCRHPGGAGPICGRAGVAQPRHGRWVAMPTATPTAEAAALPTAAGQQQQPPQPSGGSPPLLPPQQQQQPVAGDLRRVFLPTCIPDGCGGNCSATYEKTCGGAPFLTAVGNLRWQPSNCDLLPFPELVKATRCSERRFVCFVGDSQTRHLHNGYVRLMTGQQPPAVWNNSAHGKFVAVSNASRYLLNKWGDAAWSQDKELSRCTDIVVNFGQWPASNLVKTPVAPWPAAMYISALMKEREAMHELSLGGTRVYWTTTASFPIRRDFFGCGRGKGLRDGRTDPVLLLYNKLAHDVMQGRNIPVIDTYSITSSLPDATYEGAHYSDKGAVGFHVVQLVANVVCNAP